jgi:hypothetical protein
MDAVVLKREVCAPNDAPSPTALSHGEAVWLAAADDQPRRAGSRLERCEAVFAACVR